MSVTIPSLKYFIVNHSKITKCVGKKRNSQDCCRSQLSGESRKAAIALARDVEQLQHEGKIERCSSLMKSLASLLLCKRNHQDQVERVATQWSLLLPGDTCSVDSPQNRLSKPKTQIKKSCIQVVPHRPWTRSMGQPPNVIPKPVPRGCCTYTSGANDDCAICLSQGESQWATYECCKQPIHVNCGREWQKFGKTCPFW